MKRSDEGADVARFLNGMTSLVALALLASPAPVSRRQRIARRARRLLRLHVDPVPPRAAALVEQGAAAVAGLVAAIRSEE